MKLRYPTPDFRTCLSPTGSNRIPVKQLSTAELRNIANGLSFQPIETTQDYE